MENGQDKVYIFAGDLNSLLERLLPVITPVGLALGLLFPDIFIKLRPYIPLIFGVATLSGAINMKVRDIGRVFKTPVPFLFFIVFSRLLMPVIIFCKTLNRFLNHIF